MTRLFEIRSEPLSIDEVVRSVAGPTMGGISIFLGVVRDHNDGRVVTLLEYEAYASMAVKEMEGIAAEIEREIPDVRTAALHRVGSMNVGEVAVVCAAAAPHRGEAFRATRALIDRIKERVPIWKREHGPDGPYWVGWEDARCVEHGPGSEEHSHDHSSHRT